jgi:protein gp37
MSLRDLWDNQVPDAWRTDALEIIRQRRNLEWLILTKRPQNIVKMLPPDWGKKGWPHFWLGATVENMTEARRRNPILLRGPARIHWLSVVPLLGPLDLRRWLGCGIDWIVVGRETGARMLATCSPIGRVICVISAATRVPRSFSKQMWKR